MPVGWLPCEGQTLNISQYNALYSLLGTQFGGDGKTTFKLPDLRGRVVVDAGQQTGGTPYSIGNTGGVEKVTLQPTECATGLHSHQATFANPEYVAAVTDPVYAATLTDAVYGTTISGTVTPKAKTGPGTLTNNPSGAVSAPSGTSTIYSSTPNASMIAADVALTATVTKTTPGSVAISKTSPGSAVITKSKDGVVTVQQNSGAAASVAHENRQPYLALRYCIATEGIYPQRP
ncbi:MAG: hypothetical protein A2X62_11335 [Stygiobacter sp. GWC2_38_9]|nr:MAG: hypothetical protein A2X62_11335 [Stygiobacter sp. GWC2_38_9]